MTNANEIHHPSLLKRLAHQAMLDRGFLPDFSLRAITELNDIKSPRVQIEGTTKDLRSLLWSSIDNDSSLDLDQLTVAEILPNGSTKVFVAVADVDSIVKKQSAIDDHARHNTTSVYTTAQTFAMLPEKLSTNLTSLNFAKDRYAIVIEMTFAQDGSMQHSDIYRALVNNHAKLAYNSLSAWLENTGLMPKEVGVVNGLENNLRLQDKAARKLKEIRHLQGALDLETIEARPVFEGEILISLQTETRNTAKDIIEEFMVAANGVTARYFASKKFPSLRRVVRTPKRWGKIIELAAQKDFKLPRVPDSKALDEFLLKQKAGDPASFPNVSLSVIKLLGPGEYIVEIPGGVSTGHFGLAVKDYTHSTAPNRRFPDLITQRMLKAAIAGLPLTYSLDELQSLAQNCTEMEDAAKKVERQMIKSAAALLLESRIGEKFDAIVTGASEKGTWVRIANPPIEGKLVNGWRNVDVGHRLRVKLVSTDVERGFIDFETV